MSQPAEDVPDAPELPDADNGADDVSALVSSILATEARMGDAAVLDAREEWRFPVDDAGLLEQDASDLRRYLAAITEVAR